MTRHKILFVDRADNLDKMRNLAGLLGERWDSYFAQSGYEAIERLETEQFEAVVSDDRIGPAGNTDSSLINQIRERFPGVVRILLSEATDRDVVLTSVKTAHQYLVKPLDPETLRSALDNACGLRDWLQNDSIKRVVARMDSIPSIPSLYNEIMYELSLRNVSVPKIAKVISKDPGMAAKVLQVVNSAFFCLRQRVTNIAQAVNLLGYDLVQALVFSLHVFSQFVLSSGSGLNLGRVWMHSFRVAVFARAITQSETEDKGLIDDSFMAGMLHDVGKLILATNFSDEWNAARRICNEEHVSLAEAEKRIFNATHFETGGYFARLWGLPDAIVSAVSFHHFPCCLLGDAITSLMSVYAANAIEHDLQLVECEGSISLQDKHSGTSFQSGSMESETSNPGCSPGPSHWDDQGIDLWGLWAGARISTWKVICRETADNQDNL